MLEGDKSSTDGTLPDLACPLMSLGAASMLTLLLPAADGAGGGGVDSGGSGFGDVGGTSPVLNKGVDAFTGEAGRWGVEAAKPVAEQLVPGRAVGSLELAERVEAEAEAERDGLASAEVPLA